MKTLNLTCPIGIQKDMNELVDTICKIQGKDPKNLRDKFQMVTNTNPKTLNDLCKHFSLKIAFDYTKKTKRVTVSIDVKSSFNISSINEEEEKPLEIKKADPSIVVEFESVTTENNENIDEDPF